MKKNKVIGLVILQLLLFSTFGSGVDVSINQYRIDPDVLIAFVSQEGVYTWGRHHVSFRGYNGSLAVEKYAFQSSFNGFIQPFVYENILYYGVVAEYSVDIYRFSLSGGNQYYKSIPRGDQFRDGVFGWFVYPNYLFIVYNRYGSNQDTLGDYAFLIHDLDLGTDRLYNLSKSNIYLRETEFFNTSHIVAIDRDQFSLVSLDDANIIFQENITELIQVDEELIDVYVFLDSLYIFTTNSSYGMLYSYNMEKHGISLVLTFPLLLDTRNFTPIYTPIGMFLVQEEIYPDNSSVAYYDLDLKNDILATNMNLEFDWKLELSTPHSSEYFSAVIYNNEKTLLLTTFDNSFEQFALAEEPENPLLWWIAGFVTIAVVIIAVLVIRRRRNE